MVVRDRDNMAGSILVKSLAGFSGYTAHLK
jgi:hypothetical protein